MDYVKALSCLPIRLTIIAGNDLCSLPEKQNMWKATGPAPSFTITGCMPSGWVRISCLASAREPAGLNLIMGDSGSTGIKEIHALGVATADETLLSTHFYVRRGAPLFLAVESDPGVLYLTRCTARKTHKIEIILRNVLGLLQKGKITPKIFFALATGIFRVLITAGLKKCLEDIRHYIQKLHPKNMGNKTYEMWVQRREVPPGTQEEAAKAIQLLSRRPLFSIVMPVYNVDERWLRRCIESVLAQIYPHWELCIADDASPLPHVKRVLQEYGAMDSRIKVVYRPENGHISAATNSALSLATGEYMCLMDHDDEIAPDALLEFARLLDEHPETDMIYSDEDKIDGKGNRFDPFFKPDWSPEYLEACMYTAHFACYRMTIARRIEGFRTGYEGSQDHDFVLRFTELTNNIRHIPKVLYHWRTIPGSTASYSAAKDYAVEAGVQALKDRMVRLGISGTVTSQHSLPVYSYRRDVIGNPLVSIIILSAGTASIVRGQKMVFVTNSVKSINRKSSYRNYEIIIVHNRELGEEMKMTLSGENCRLIRYDKPFDFAKENNFGAGQAKGEYLLFLNDDTDVISQNWLEAMLGFCQKADVGAVGARLYTEDKHIQHVGVSILSNGLPSHLYYGYPGSIPGYFFAISVNRNCLAVTGAALMTKKSIFDEIGGFNEKFPINYNDIDYCLRLRERGKRVVYAAEAELYHYESQSRGKTVKPEEEARFLDLWGSATEKDPFYNPHLNRKYLNYEIDIR